MDTVSILTAISVIVVGLLAGSMTFFSAVMAPLIFVKLEMDVAGKFVRAVFPWYYLLIIVLGTAGGVSLFAALPLNAGMLLLVATSAIYCRQSLMPRINSYRDQSLAGGGGSDGNDGRKEAGKIFNRLHKRSEIINGLQLLAVIAVLLHLAFFIELP